MAPMWQDLLIESIDAVRTMLLHDFRAESLQVILITSAAKGEGKSSLSSHLAISLARTGRRILLDRPRPAKSHAPEAVRRAAGTGYLRVASQ